MTNKELKRQSFLEATRNRKAKQEAHYQRFPERKLYDEGTSSKTWKEGGKRDDQVFIERKIKKRTGRDSG